jgi:membrane associated rhomboid family serine protease
MIHLHFVGEQDEGRHTPYVTWTLVLVNVIAFAAMLLSDLDRQAWIEAYGLTPAHPHAFQFLSANFVHGGWLHLGCNMLFLLIFGDNVEDVLGPLAFLGLYLLGGLAGDVLFITANPDMAIPSVGASGCISTIAGAYGVMFWNRAIDVDVCWHGFAMEVGLPAILVMLFWFGTDVWMTTAGLGVLEGHGGINYVAHGAGFLVGVLAGFVVLAMGAVGRYWKYRDGHHLLFGYLPSVPVQPRRPSIRVR